MAAFKTYLFTLFGLLLAVYLNYPAPTNMSSNLTMWKMRAAKTIIFKKTKIFYKDEPGTKVNAPVLVCLHGFPTSSYDWLKVWPALLQKFSRVIAPDFLGFGFSDKPTDHNYSIKEQADLVEHLLNYQRVKEIHILAHDYGDTVAQELLARYEDRLKDGMPKLIIKSVCLLNGGIFPDTHFPQPIQEALLIPYVGDILARLTNIYTFKRSFGSVFGPDTQPTEAEFNDFWTVIRKNDGNLVIPKLLQYIPERMEHKERLTKVLQKTKVPVHVIYGPADPVNPPEFVSFYKEVVPDASITVLQGHVGHYPQWEDSAECMSAYFAFLRSLPFSVAPEAQPTPDITTSTKITGQKLPPKVVLEKMKAGREEAEKAKLKTAEKPKEGQKKEQKQPTVRSGAATKQEMKTAKETKKGVEDGRKKEIHDLPKGTDFKRRSKLEEIKVEHNKDGKPLKDMKPDEKPKNLVNKEGKEASAEQQQKVSAQTSKDRAAKSNQARSSKSGEKDEKIVTKKISEKDTVEEKMEVKHQMKETEHDTKAKASVSKEGKKPSAEQHQKFSKPTSADKSDKLNQDESSRKGAVDEKLEVVHDSTTPNE